MAAESFLANLYSGKLALDTAKKPKKPCLMIKVDDPVLVARAQEKELHSPGSTSVTGHQTWNSYGRKRRRESSSAKNFPNRDPRRTSDGISKKPKQETPQVVQIVIPPPPPVTRRNLPPVVAPSVPASNLAEINESLRKFFEREANGIMSSSQVSLPNPYKEALEKNRPSPEDLAYFAAP